MKAFFITIIILAAAFNMYAQDKYMTKSGHIWFYSKTPLEVVEAHNNQVASVIDVRTAAIAFEVIIKSFKFERALMEEHFNENYMESDKFPKSTFTGKFADFDVANFNKNGTYKVKVEGELKIHGVKNHIKETGTLQILDGAILANAKFNINPEDYGIYIPGIVRDKIAKDMETTIEMKYEPYKK